MYNMDALNYSNSVIQEQCDFLLSTRPYIKNISINDNSGNNKADYLYGIDAWAHTHHGTSERIQFKNRREGNNDFSLIALKLSGVNAEKNEMGFWYRGNKYSFLPKTDLIVERINGMDCVVTADEIEVIEYGLSRKEDTSDIISGIAPKIVYADDGSEILTGEYYVYISLPELANMLTGIHQFFNPNLYSDKNTAAES